MAKTRYIVIDLDTGNEQGCYDSEGAALAMIAETARRLGRKNAEALALGAETGVRLQDLGTGPALVDRALTLDCKSA